MDGVLRLGVRTDSAAVTTIISGLEHPKVLLMKVQISRSF